MSFVKLLLSFAPWICFLILARGSLLQLKIALGVSLAISVVMGLSGLHRGIILWVGLSFFAAATVAVVGFENLWTVRHLGVLANGALGLGAWGGLLIGRPFTLDYARAHTDPALWNDPAFIRVNQLITALWAGVFSLNAALAWGKMEQIALPSWGYEVLSYTALVAVAAFTSWYPAHLRRIRTRA